MSSQYATLTSRELDPAECDHDRRTKYDSHRCLDCGAEVTLPELVCGICGEREGSVYAKRCCTDEQMVEV